jgi:hypothetical protein
LSFSPPFRTWINGIKCSEGTFIPHRLHQGPIHVSTACPQDRLRQRPTELPNRSPVAALIRRERRKKKTGPTVGARRRRTGSLRSEKRFPPSIPFIHPISRYGTIDQIDPIYFPFPCYIPTTHRREKAGRDCQGLTRFL